MTCSALDRAAVERLGAVAIDYRTEDFLARMRELPGKSVDVVLDGLGGALSLRSFRALRPGGRLVVFGHSATLVHGHKSWRGWVEWYAATATVALWGLLSPRRRVWAYRIQKLREAHQLLPVGSHRPLPWVEVPATRKSSGRTSWRCSSCFVRGAIHPVVAERMPLTDARRAHELFETSAAKGKLVLVP
jgi:NADPH:quinone reductase